jgi:hypothetical protein
MKKTVAFILSFILLYSFFGSRFVQAVDVQFPLIQSMSYFPYAEHNTLEKKDLRLTLDIFHSNIYTYDPYHINVQDMEMFSGTLALGYGLSDRLTLEFYFKATHVFGGILDKLIMDFHKVFGLPEGGRNDFPRNMVNYRYKDAFLYDSTVTTASPLVFGVLGNLYSSEKLDINGRVSIGVPLSSKAGFSSNKPFLTAGLVLLYNKGSRKFSMTFSNHMSFFKAPEWLEGEDLRERIFHSELRIDYRRFFGGLMHRSTPFKEDELSNPATIIYVGIKVLKNVEFALIEEFPPMDTTPDVSFQLRVKLLKK